MPGGYVVRDSDGQTLAAYPRDNEAEARQATKDEARRVDIISRGCRSCSEKPIAAEPSPFPARETEW
jgi:hypothetical protein